MTEPPGSPDPDDAWPSLDGPDVRETCATLLLWSQIIGKTKLALCPMVNHWWQITLRVSARGLLAAGIPAAPAVGSRTFDVELDFVAHRLHVRCSDGRTEELPLRDRTTLAAFYADYMERLRRLGIALQLYPYAVETPERVRLDQDTQPRRYDPAAANRYFRALTQASRVLEEFRGRFVGKASPVQFFWGGFDLAATRFSGRRAPAHPGGVPNVGDWVMREAYSHEVSSAGFWPGDARLPEAAFYAYAYPEPPGFAQAAVRPAAARYLPSLGEFVLPYAAVRSARDPAADVLAFLESTYVAAADLARWDRPALERQPEP